MKVRTLLTATAVLGLLSARDAAAQKLSLQIEKGLVTLDAESVTVDEILARWTASTGLNVISKNGRGSEIPVTVQITGMPERDALALVLRDLSGYIMGERRDPRTGFVTIDRVLILPDSAAQASTLPVSRAATPPPVAPPFASTLEPAPLPQPAAEPEPNATFTLDSSVELAPAPDGATFGIAGEDAGVAQGQLVDDKGNILADRQESSPTPAPTAPLQSQRPGTIVAPAPTTGALRTTPRVVTEDAPQ